MIYRFRIILDTEEDVFRDIEIKESTTLEELHNVIIQSFGFDGSEMASFYTSDDQWNQGEEISLFDMSDGNVQVRLMSETILSDVVHEASVKLIYIYDFLSMWTFMVELAEIVEYNADIEYPNVMFTHGQLPDNAPEKEFKADDINDYFVDDGFEDGLHLDLNNYNETNFSDNWN